MRQAYIGLVGLFSVTHAIFTAIYMIQRPWTFMGLITMVIHDTLVLLGIAGGVGLLWFGCILWYCSAKYFSLKFDEIHKSVKWSLRQRSTRHMMEAIIQHNYWEVQVWAANRLFRWVLFFIVFVGTTGMELSLYAIHNPNITTLVRVMAVVNVALVTSLLYAMIIMSSWIARSAHKPYPLLFSFLCQTRGLSTRNRLKVLTFIERLSTGPAIGYYCYDLFVMNRYHLYQYLYICGANYLLFIGIFE